MRVFFCCKSLGMLFVLSFGMAYAQDTNFATGPQYLINGDPTNHASPLFARSISTPSMSLAGPPPQAGASNSTEGLSAGADTQTFPPQPHPAVNLSPIYYTEVSPSDLTLSFLAEPFPGLLQQTSPTLSPEPSPMRLPQLSPGQLPPSILDSGVWQITTAQALRERGYGITVAEAAAFDKSRTRRATHVYTNDDVRRLHGSD
jgi:hypothetical protein